MRHETARRCGRLRRPGSPRIERRGAGSDRADRRDPRALLEGFPHAVVVSDENRRVLGRSRRFLELFGVDPHEPATTIDELALAGGLLQAIPPGAAEAFLAGWRDALAAPNGTPVHLALHDGATLAVSVGRESGGDWISTFEDVTSRREAEARAERLARLDPLTELPNRKQLREGLAEALAEQGETAVLYLDLDRFKAVNDTLGHPVGDGLLRMVADRLRSAVRTVDLVARVGGDEFAILQRGADQPDAAAALAKRLVDLVGRAYVLDGHLVNIGVSVGVAVAPGDGADADKLLHRADLALYAAKAEGRGTYRFFQPEMDARMQARRALELDLRRALAMREFEVFYQPQVRVGSTRIASCEALLRWNHPERGLVSPTAFIPLAEELGLITSIGAWVLRTACLEAAGWPEGVSVAVNLSPAQFANDALVETVVAALHEARLPPERLELEITESLLLNDSGTTLETLHRLRALGVRIAMDDFGTGYSSLSYLIRFPFDKIKIDRCFVQGLFRSGEAAAVIRAVTGLGASLGMTTTAEGVETVEQFARLRDEGCTDIQGYLVSRPVPAADLARFLDAGPGWVCETASGPVLSVTPSLS